MSENWKILTEKRDFLKNFYKATKFIEDRSATINRVLSVLDFLLLSHEEATLNHDSDDFVALVIDSEYSKLQKYCDLNTKRASIYIATIVLGSDWIQRKVSSSLQSLTVSVAYF